METQTTHTIVIVNKKSTGTAILLAFLFGPLGLFYASVVGGLVMIVVAIILMAAAGPAGSVIAWIGSIIWAASAVQNTVPATTVTTIHTSAVPPPPRYPQT